MRLIHRLLLAILLAVAPLAPELRAESAISTAPYPGRVKLNGLLVLWVVGTTGNDATTDGTTFASAFKTIQAAVNAAESRYDTNGYNIQIQISQPAGPYTSPVVITGPLAGNGQLILYGTGGTGVASISVTTGAAITVQSGAFVQLQNLNIATTGAAYDGVYVTQRGYLTINSGVTFGNVGAVMLDIANGTLFLNAGFAVAGNATTCLHIRNKSMAILDGQTITVTGTPAFSAYFLGAAEGSSTSAIGTTISGASTGPRYFIHYGATVRTSNTGLASAIFFPGSLPGTIQRGGVLDNLGGGQIVQLAQITSNSSLVLPVGARISSITLANTSGNAVTGGINIGTTSLGSDVVAGAASAANSDVDTTILKRVFSATADQTLYISAATAWNGAVVTAWIAYDAPAAPL